MKKKLLLLVLGLSLMFSGVSVSALTFDETILGWSEIAKNYEQNLVNYANGELWNYAELSDSGAPSGDEEGFTENTIVIPADEPLGSSEESIRYCMDMDFNYLYQTYQSDTTFYVVSYNSTGVVNVESWEVK